MEILYERCAGLDIGKDEVVACLRTPDARGGRRQEVRTLHPMGCHYPTRIVPPHPRPADRSPSRSSAAFTTG